MMNFSDKFNLDKKELIKAIENGDKETAIWLYDYAVFQAFNLNGFANFYSDLIKKILKTDEDGALKYIQKEYGGVKGYITTLNEYVQRTMSGYKAGGIE